MLVALPIRADDVVAFFFEAFREVRGCSFREGGGEIGQRTRSGVDGFLFFFETKALARYYIIIFPRFCMGDDRRHLPPFAIERKDDDDDDDRERRGFHSFSAFSNRASFETSPKKTRGGGGGGVSAKPSEEKKKPKDRERSISASPNTQKKEKERQMTGRTDKSTRSRDAYLELRFRPVRLGPVDPAERVLFARGVRSRRVFGGGGHFDICVVVRACVE